MKNPFYVGFVSFGRNKNKSLITALMGLFFYFMSCSSVLAQVTLSLTYAEKNGVTSVPSGDEYTMQLNYAVSSTTGNATGVKIVVNLPDNIYDVRNFVGTIHAPISNFVFSDVVGAKTLTINFVSPLASGSNGVLEFGILTNNLTTLNNTTLATNATLTATGGYTSGVKNHNMNVTAIPRICAEKALLSGGALDYSTTYRISVRTGGYGVNAPLGTLQATNISLKDTLPVGATFVSAKIYDVESGGTFIGNATESGGVVTAAIPNLSYYQFAYGNVWQAKSYFVDVVVQYNSPTFSVGDIVNNKAVVFFTPYNGTPDTLTDGESIGGTCVSVLTELLTIEAPVVTATLANNGCGNIYPGNQFDISWNFDNAGNVPLDNVEISMDIPSSIRIDQTVGYYGVRFDGMQYLNHFEYQTNLTGAVWQTHNYSSSYDVAPLLPSGEYFTKIKFVLNSPLAANTTLPGYYLLTFKPAYEPVLPETVNACLVWNSTTAGIPALSARTICNNCYTLEPRPSTAKIRYAVSNAPSCISLLTIGQNITFTGTVVADEGYSDAQNPIVAMFIPHGYQFISESFGVGTSGIGIAPTLQIIPDYIMVGSVSKDLYRWTFPSGTVLPYGTNFTVSATVEVTAGLSSTETYITDFIATSTNASAHQPENVWAGNMTDTGDWDLDLNTVESFPKTTNDYCCYSCHISSAASMESRKWVKGELDEDYSRYPDFGFTVQGGQADYKLIVKNTGNVPMKDIKIIDVLPFIGDVGVIDPSARNTQWRPNLAGPIAAPAGINIYYSTVSNPCRDEVKQPTDPSPFPTGCATANWSITPPLDITTVQAVKIDFGTKILDGSDSLIFNWPMRAPVDAPINNEIAWNSFAFAATRTDNNAALIPAEPIKVGIKVQAPSPAIYGDRVWLDTDHDGVQDLGENGVSGVLVDIYRDNGDGVTDLSVDTKVDFTITDDNGNYLFPNLIPGNYFAHFILPMGYVASPSDMGGNDAFDSDGEITMVTNLISTEDDRSWDLGIYSATACDVHIYNYTVSECVYSVGGSYTTVNVFLAWSNAPVGQTINVNVTGAATQNINPATLSSPQLVSFQVPADGLEHIITAAYTGGCAGVISTKNFFAPPACVTSVCSLMITEVKTSLCMPDAGSGHALVDVWVEWSNASIGKDIIVNVAGLSDTIKVSKGVFSPVLLTFQVPADASTGNVISAFFDGASCSDTDTYDAPGGCVAGSVGDYVWSDNDGDGVQDASESGINGVIVELWASADLVAGNGDDVLKISTTTSNDVSGNAGYYYFEIMQSAKYYVKFPTSINTQTLTTQTATAATNGNSDADVNGRSPIFLIDVNGVGVAKDNPTIDAGYMCNVTAGIVKSNDLSCPLPTATLTASPSTGVLYLWENGSTSATRTVTAAGTYSVMITEAATGCTATANVNVSSVISTPPCINVGVQKTK